MKFIEASNEPSVLPEGTFENVEPRLPRGNFAARMERCTRC